MTFFGVFAAGAGSALAEAAGGAKATRRLHRHLPDRAGLRQPAGRDGPRRGSRLVRLQLHRRMRDGGGDRPVRRGGMAEQREEPGRQHARLRQPQLRGRLRHDLRDGDGAVFQRGQHSAAGANGTGLHRDLGGPDPVAGRAAGLPHHSDRRQDHALHPDTVRDRDRIPASGRFAGLFARADSGHRLQDPGPDAGGAEFRARLSCSCRSARSPIPPCRRS